MENIRRMPYRQYKTHYSDCKTVYGSYDSSAKTIDVIIPDGREKPSGTRGQRFNYFPGVYAYDDHGERVYIGGLKALTWSNAVQQVERMGYHDPFTQSN